LRDAKSPGGETQGRFESRGEGPKKGNARRGGGKDEKDSGGVLKIIEGSGARTRGKKPSKRGFVTTARTNKKETRGRGREKRKKNRWNMQMQGRRFSHKRKTHLRGFGAKKTWVSWVFQRKSKAARGR